MQVHRTNLKPTYDVWKFNFDVRLALLGQKLRIWHYFDHREYGMYVHRIIFKPIQIVWKLNVDEFRCKIRRFKPKIDDLTGDVEGGQFCPPHEFSASVDPHEE